MRLVIWGQRQTVQNEWKDWNRQRFWLVFEEYIKKEPLDNEVKN